MASRDRLLCALIGLAQGAVFWLASEYWPDDAPGRALAMAAVFFAAAAGLVAHLAWTGRDHGRLAAIALAIGALFAPVAYWVWAQIPVTDAGFAGDDYRWSTWSAAALLSLYVLLPFAQVFQRSGRLRFPYRDLFFHAWTNAFVALMGQVYAGVFFVLIRLWGGLFDLIGVSFFSHVFETEWFIGLSLPTVAAYGLAMGRENARFPDAGRAAALTVFRFLMPLLAGIELLFLGTLPFTGLEALWSTRHASALLLTLSGLVVLFLNAVFEDGEGSPPYAPPVRRGVEAAVAALPIASAITAYSIWLRVDQYGLTPDRVYAVVLCGVTSAFATGYAAAVLWRRGRWLGLVRPINVALSLAVVVIAFLLHTPVLDPLRWSARSQVARLLEGRVDAATFDFASLHFHLGHAGEQALARLRAATDHPQHASIAAGIRNLDFYEAQPAGRRIRDEDLEVIAPLTHLPEGFRQFLDGMSDPTARDSCSEGSPCPLFALDLDGDGVLEHCLVTAKTAAETWSPARCFARTQEEGWKGIGALVGEGGSVDAAELRAGGAESATPRLRDVRVGERTFRLIPGRAIVLSD